MASIINSSQLDTLKRTAAKSRMRYRLAAGLFDSKGNLICMGYNRRSNRTRYSIHAEEDCIAKFIRAYYPRKIKPSFIVVVRINPRGELKLSKPCDNCNRIIEESGVKTYYTLDNGELNACHN